MSLNKLPPSQISLNKGIFIVIDGIDGSGKTTQVGLLAKKYIDEGFNVTVTKEPTNSYWGKKIKEIAKKGRNNISPQHELDLFIKDREEDVSNTIRPALLKKHLVIADRYYYSNIAYQGSLGMDPNYIKQINEKKFPIPDIVILLDISPKAAISRILKGRGEKNNIGFEQEDYLNKVRKIFKKFIDDAIVQEIDSTPPINDVFKNIINLTDGIVNPVVAKTLIPKMSKPSFDLL